MNSSLSSQQKLLWDIHYLEVKLPEAETSKLDLEDDLIVAEIERDSVKDENAELEMTIRQDEEFVALLEKELQDSYAKY